MDDKEERMNKKDEGCSALNEEKDFNPGPELAPTLIKHTLAHVSSSIVHAACKLEIFDHFHENGPEMTAGALAEKMGASEMNLRRLMNACVRLDLLKTQTTENGEIVYSNTDEGDIFLRKRSERSWVPYVNWVNIFQKKVLDLIDEAVMKGGVGIHAKSMKLAYPPMKVSVLEVESFFNRMKMQGKILDNQYFSYITGDFFNQLPSADLFLLSHILHDWPDEKCDIILHNVYEALPSGGGLLILQKLYNNHKESIVDLALDMARMVSFNGKERSREEYKMMLEKHGFGNIKIWAEVAQSFTDVIFALKP